MLTLASLRSDRWTASPELLDDFIGLRNCEVHVDRSPQVDASSHAVVCHKNTVQVDITKHIKGNASDLGHPCPKSGYFARAIASIMLNQVK